MSNPFFISEEIEKDVYNKIKSIVGCDFHYASIRRNVVAGFNESLFSNFSPLFTLKPFLDVAYLKERDRFMRFVVLEDSCTENIIPYFDMRVFINLDTMNIIYAGARGVPNIVLLSLKALAEEHNVKLDRDAILCALEDYCFNCPDKMENLFPNRVGSIIGRSLGMTSSFYKIFYEEVKSSIDRFYLCNPEFFPNRIVDGVVPADSKMYYMMECFRAAGLDYTVYACLGKKEIFSKLESFLKVKLGANERLYLYNYIKDDRISDVELLNNKKLYKFYEGYRQNADCYIDLGRIVSKVNSIMNK